MQIAQQVNLEIVEQEAKINLPSSTIGGLISRFLPYLFAAAGILLLLYLLYGGFHFMVSRGDPKDISEAKQKITYALIGFIIVFTAYWIVQAAGLILGLEGITNIFQ